MWIELTDSPYDGKVWDIPWATTTPSTHALVGLRGLGPVEMAATGSVRWDGDDPVEVYVPEDRLDLRRAEHDVEPLGRA